MRDIGKLVRNMAFRSNDSEEEGRNRAVLKFITRHLGSNRERSGAALHNLIDRFGPVVDAYPYWHPIVTSKEDREMWVHPFTIPGPQTGFHGLDHTIYLKNGFITCPYGGTEQIYESVAKLASNPVATITAHDLDFPLYMPNAQPVFVKCEWSRPLKTDGSIPLAIAVPLLLEQEIPNWRRAEVAETWETMRPYILGQPCGSRSSLFVNQETGQFLKNFWNTLINTGMYGPIYVAR